MTIQAGMLPELQIGVETPWPLKREGKQVYAKLIDFGGIPVQLRAKTHDVPDIEWSQISWDHSYVASSTDGRRRSLALVSTPENFGGSMPWRFQADSTSVQVNMLGLTNYQAWDTVVLCLLYTKTGDGAASGELVIPGPDGKVLTSRDNDLVWEEAGGGCDCEIATPDLAGLVPKDGQAGQVYGVRADGSAYGFFHPRMTSVILTKSGSFIAPYTGSYVVRCQGGGGAGSGVGANLKGRYIGSGGNSGQFKETIINLEEGQTIAFIIGNGGAGTYHTGSNGGATSFGNLPAAEGGLAAFTTDVVYTYNWDFPYIGTNMANNGFGSEMGENGYIRTWSNAGAPLNMQSGRGGGSRYGSGGLSKGSGNVEGSGFAASGYGAGGGGAIRFSGQTLYTGGSGAPGCIEIIMFDFGSST